MIFGHRQTEEGIILETKFKIGQELAIKRHDYSHSVDGYTGWTGTVIMIDIYEKKYLLDCHPGALGMYDWLWLRNEKGEPQLYAANWIPEEDLESLPIGEGTPFEAGQG